MIYVLNLIVTVLYSYLIKSTKILNYIPILLIWIIILGGQYEVGKDYRNYLDFFYGIRDSKLFFIQKEYLFYYFLKIMSFLFSNGRSPAAFPAPHPQPSHCQSSPRPHSQACSPYNPSCPALYPPSPR